MEKQIKAEDGHSCNGILIGMILGDSYLYKSSPTANTGITTAHSIDHEDYLQWKKECLGNYFPLGNWRKRILPERGNWKQREIVTWRPGVNKRLNYLYQDFYLDREKIVKKSVLNRLTPLGLAIWYMDDGNLDIGTTESGYKHFHGISLATNAFDNKSRDVIIKWFNEILGMTFKSTKKGAIFSDGPSGWRFLSIVKPYGNLISSMKYKVSPEDRVDVSKSRIYSRLPQGVLDRLEGKDNSTPSQGYVNQVFPQCVMALK